MSVKDYITLQYKDSLDLDAEVNILLQDGWELYGDQNVVVVSRMNQRQKMVDVIVYSQVMILR